MRTLFDQMDRAAILRRVGGLTPERMPLWGKFTAPEMVCHVSAGLRQALGDLDAGKPAGVSTSRPSPASVQRVTMVVTVVLDACATRV